MTQMFTPTRPVPPLPGTSLLRLKATTLLELGDAVQTGFQPTVLEAFGKHLGLNLGEALGLLGLSESTYHSYRREKRPMKPDISASLYQLARVTEAAEAYFENVQDAHLWLQTQRQTFGGRTPLQFALLPGGAEYVTTVLSRLEHGVYT